MDQLLRIFDVFGYHVTWGSYYGLLLINGILMYALGYKSNKWIKR